LCEEGLRDINQNSKPLVQAKIFNTKYPNGSFSNSNLARLIYVWLLHLNHLWMKCGTDNVAKKWLGNDGQPCRNVMNLIVAANKKIYIRLTCDWLKKSCDAAFLDDTGEIEPNWSWDRSLETLISFS